jgi:L-Lysine epsilon oxidase N-terminal/L-lysine epsilon oxidase C-terminal domain
LDVSSIAKIRIHPAIGIARVGNSEDEYFIGPELPYPTPQQLGFYKDAQGKLKRQAALFRLYAYDANGRVLGEITTDSIAGEETTIGWTVHVANKKAAWYDFDVALDIPEATANDEQSQIRNAAFTGADRAQLVIDPGPRSIAGRSAASVAFDTGEFVGTKVYLGELRTDEAGRLLFLGGRGVSASFQSDTAPVTFANNDGWHDDTSDGPVHATVTVGGTTFEADPAWVVTAPPNYGPDIVTPQTMYDVLYDTFASGFLPPASSKGWKPSFRNDILPLLQQMVDAQWVNAGFLNMFGWEAPNDFTRADLLDRLARPKPAQGDDPYRELRVQVFNMLRVPPPSDVTTGQNAIAWPPLYGDAFGNYYGSPRVYFNVTPTKYTLFRRWSEGDFVDDRDQPDGRVTRFEELPLELQPSTLDMAALHWCMGGPFHPGCEMTWPMRQLTMYREAFRIRERPATLPEPSYGPYITPAIINLSDGPLFWNAPGDITRWMAVPWQTDTASCRAGYAWPGNPLPNEVFIPSFWPSRVPNDVLTAEDYDVVVNAALPLEERMHAFFRRQRWLRNFDYDGPYIPQITRMITEFGDLGVVEARDNPNGEGDPFPRVLYVESVPTVPAPPHVLRAARTHAHELRPNEQFAFVRFGGLGRR